MTMPNVFAADPFQTISLTTRANDADIHPFVETYLASVFETTSITDIVAQLERGTSGIELIEAGTREVVSPESTLGRAKIARYVGSTKIGRVISVAPRDIQSVRQLGSQAVETMQSIVDSKLNPVLRSIDNTHEYLRAGALKGVQLDADGVTVLNDFYQLFNIAKPGEFSLELDATAPAGLALRSKLTAINRVIRDALGDAPMAGIGCIVGDDVADGLRYGDETKDAFARWEDLAQPTEAASLKAFRYGGVDFIPYRGAGLAADEARFFPKGVPGMFKTVFTPADTVSAANTMAWPRYVTPKTTDGRADYDKGWSAEVASFPIHYCLRPEALIGARAGTAAE